VEAIGSPIGHKGMMAAAKVRALSAVDLLQDERWIEEAKVDFRRVETASRKIPTAFSSPEVKRLFVRFFNILQLNMHFISVMVRTKLPHEAVEQVERSVQEQIDKVAEKLNGAIDGADVLCQANGITSIATYDTAPLVIDVMVISMFGRRFLELMSKMDQLMPMLETLAIYEVITIKEMDRRKAAFKRSIRQIAGAARNLRAGVHRRMHTAQVTPFGKMDEVTGAERPGPVATVNDTGEARNDSVNSIPDAVPGKPDAENSKYLRETGIVADSAA
jgi:hypothetical protein